MVKYQVILFDIDNTLINSADLVASTLRNGALKEGIDVPLSEYRKRIGQTGEHILKEFGVKNWQRVLSNYMVEFGENMNQLSYFPGIEALLLILKKAKVRTGVVTSKDRIQFDKEMAHFPLIAREQIITTSDLTTHPKPSSEPLTYTISTHGLDPIHTLYVGDSIFDMQSAHKAGLDFAVADWGALPEAQFPTARYQLQNPMDLLKLV